MGKVVRSYPRSIYLPQLEMLSKDIRVYIVEQHGRHISNKGASCYQDCHWSHTIFLTLTNKNFRLKS